MTRTQALVREGKHYINGQWIIGSGEPLQSLNPFNNQLLWQGYHATKDEVSLACNAAHDALPKWSHLPLQERCHYLREFSKEVEKRCLELAELIAEENGKPVWEAMTEVSSVIAKVNLSMQAYDERNAEKITIQAELTSCLRYKPHGVVGVFGPFNFPAHLSNGHIIPALLAGNTVVLKPSELTPAVAQFLMSCWHAAELPAGVLNCIHGGAATGRWLLENDLQGVYFTGSYETGKKIHQQLSAKPEVILALEMGGNNPLIIDVVNDLDAAVYQTILSAFITSGQRCTCARRIYIPNNAFGEKFLQKLLYTTQHLQVGAPNQHPEPFMGPVISHQHALSHLQAHEQLISNGGVALLPMQLLIPNSGLLSPGIIDMSNVPAFNDQEIFAPLLQLYRYDQFEDALQEANRTRYGLSAALFSDSLQRYQQFFQQIRAGLINWNRATTGAASNLPFGGVGASGNHRPCAYFAADYCSYPISSQEQFTVTTPASLLPGILLE